MCSLRFGLGREANVADSDSSRNDSSIEEKRSNVRRRVTYWVIGTYLLLAGVVVVWLMCVGRHDLAIGVLGGVAGIAGSITGFWFGARRPAGTSDKNHPQD